MSIRDRMEKAENIQEAMNLGEEAVGNLDDYVSDFVDAKLPVVVQEAAAAMAAMYGTEFVVRHNMSIVAAKRFCDMIHNLSRACYAAGVRDERFRHLN